MTLNETTSLVDQLRQVFVTALELSADTDVESLTYRDIDAWDSLGHMTLIAAIEDSFDVQFETEQVIDMSSFRIALDMVRGMSGHDD